MTCHNMCPEIIFEWMITEWIIWVDISPLALETVSSVPQEVVIQINFFPLNGHSLAGHGMSLNNNISKGSQPLSVVEVSNRDKNSMSQETSKGSRNPVHQ